MRARHLLAIAGPILLLGAATPTATAAADRGQPTYYLSLGDSLAQGVQPLGPKGASIVTDQGYADDLYHAMQLRAPSLQLEKLGCPGETSGTMISGGACTYGGFASQLQAAVAFLTAHRDHVKLVSIDIGANDVDGCATLAGISSSCVASGLQSVATNLPIIVGVLRKAAPHARIEGMTYYDPFLAAWLLGDPGKALAQASLPITREFNQILSVDFGAADIPVAPVADAFRTFDATPLPLVGLPVDVAVICSWTWMCARSPQGPNIHPNQGGYAAIAAAFLSRFPGLAPGPRDR